MPGGAVGAHRNIHFRDRVDARRAEDRALFYRPQACRRELGGGAVAAGSELGPPIQMCDALSRNPPKEFQVILANCIAHGRRKFVEVAENFPEECRYVLKQLGKVYKNDALAREQGMSPEERLRFHQVESGPRMKELETWFQEQFAERKVERSEERRVGKECRDGWWERDRKK